MSAMVLQSNSWELVSHGKLMYLVCVLSMQSVQVSGFCFVYMYTWELVSHGKLMYLVCVLSMLVCVKPIYPLNHAAETQSALAFFLYTCIFVETQIHMPMVAYISTYVARMWSDEAHDTYACVCMYVCDFTYTSTCVYGCIDLCIYKLTNMHGKHLRVHLHPHTFMHTFTRDICTDTYTKHLHVIVDVYTFLHTICVHICIHIHVYMIMYMYV
jgi:hypothetical protein